MRLSKKICVPFLMAPLLLAAACSRDKATGNTETAAASPAAADNTKVNERDRGNSVTPMDQGNNAADLDTSQKIRKALMADDSLSTDAKNAKIITANGVVVLRGPVNSDAERQNLDAKARQLAGPNRVENHLEVATVK